MCRQWSIQSLMGCLYQTLPSWLRYLMAKSKQKRREVVMTLRKQHLPDSKGLMHTWAQRLQHGEDLPKVKLDKNPSTVSSTKSQPWIKKLFAIETYGERESKFSSKECPKTGLMLKSSWSIQKWASWFLCCLFCCCCCSYCCLAFYFVLLFVWFFFF